MDNDKFVVFQSATVAEFEILEAIRRLEDSLAENRKTYCTMYVMLQDLQLATDADLERLIKAAEMTESSLTNALAQMRERLAHAKRTTDWRWQDYIYS